MWKRELDELTLEHRDDDVDKNTDSSSENIKIEGTDSGGDDFRGGSLDNIQVNEMSEI